MMIKLVGVLVLLVCYQTLADSPLEGTELVFTFLVHRHGDRTPVESSLQFSNNPEKLQELSEPYGYGQLTNAGKRRAYELGKFIRDRYSELLSPKYNRSEIYIRSTDSTRTKMTVLTAMAAVYPPGEDSWSNKIDWVPLPYTTVPAKYDFNLALLNCPVFEKGYLKLGTSSSASMARYSGVLDLLSENLGFNLTAYPVLAYAVYDVYTSQLSLGLPLDPEIEAVFPEVEAAAGAAIDIIFGNDEYVDLQAGVMLNEFFKYASDVMAGSDTQRVRVYSAHDYNVYSFLAVTQISDKQGVPKYGSAYALELRRVIETGEYVVVPTYLPSPGEQVKYLTVAGCDVACSFEQFHQITSSYALDEDTWRTKCGFTNDIVIDDSSIA